MTTPKKRSKSKRLVLSILIFVLGLGIAAYPLISQWYYRTEANQEIQAFDKAVNEMEKAEIERRMALAMGYNKTLDPSRIGDPFTRLEKEGVAEYARMLEINEKVGHIHIPKINQDLPVYAGTSEAVLQKGVGHLEETSLPTGGESTHSVLTAHRGLPTARLFTDLDKLEIGDRFYMHNIATVMAYKVVDVMTVEPTDFNPVLVVEGKDYLTLLTCTPYMVNSHRLLVRGERIDYTAAIEEDKLSVNAIGNTYRYLFYGAAVLLVVAVGSYVGLRKQHGRREA